MLKISVHELQNDLILSLSQGGFSGARNDGGRVYIGDTYLITYIPEHINTISNRNMIIFGFETCWKPTA